MDTLWIAEHLRGQGYGEGLLAAAEQEAMRRGCRHAHLETMSFQALSFYLKHGYTVYATLEGFPEGHSRYGLRKTLVE